MTPADRLIAAWIDWETLPSAPQTVARKMDLLHELDLDPATTHETIATWRRDGYDVPSAVQAYLNESAPHLAVTLDPMQPKEAA